MNFFQCSIGFFSKLIFMMAQSTLKYGRVYFASSEIKPRWMWSCIYVNNPDHLQQVLQAELLGQEAEKECFWYIYYWKTFNNLLCNYRVWECSFLPCLPLLGWVFFLIFANQIGGKKVTHKYFHLHFLDY